MSAAALRGPPRAHLLAHGDYSVMISEAGSGYSRWRDIALTRWREDPTCDPYGFFVFLRDAGNGQVWSAGYQPTGREPDRYEVSFAEDCARIVRADGAMLTTTEIRVSTEDAAEVRCVSITNGGRSTREIEVTYYAEVVLGNAAADSAHAAFSKMFVQTEFVADSGTLLATRRVREPGEAPLWMFQVSALEGESIGALQFETDRARFLGRGCDLRSAVSIVDARPLSDTVGTVLDPILAVRRRARIAPGATARLSFWSGVAGSRPQALALAAKCRDTRACDRISHAASDEAQARLRALGVDAAEAELFQRLASGVLYCDASLRAAPATLARNESGPRVLWSLGVSGDLPIVLVCVDAGSGSDAGRGLDLVRQLLRARDYWRLKRLAIDLVIVDDREAGQSPGLDTELDAAVKEALGRSAEASARSGASSAVGGGIFALRGDTLTPPSRELLETAARVILRARLGSLAEQLSRPSAAEATPRRRIDNQHGSSPVDDPRSIAALEFFNGFGGFSADGREYVTVIKEGQWTPAPWINVIANPQFGFLVSADGVGSTWSLNAQQNQLTPWSNDPVGNAPSEVVYVRDAQSGELWSATPLPILEPACSYLVRHGFGHTRFQHTSRGISLDLLQFVPLEAAIKIARLKIVNRSPSARQLSITHYVEWVLGSQRGRMAPFIVTEIDAATGALLARNPWSVDFPARVAFLDMGGRQRSATGDRTEFLGRYGSLGEPGALLAGGPLSNRVGGGLDPCGALETTLSLEPGEEVEIVLALGQEASRSEALALLRRYRDIDLDAAFTAVTDFWEETLGAIQVKSPDRSMDVLLNGWLLYQTLACRLWGRTAFYQSSGAWGYRDQLQDVMALCVARPAIAREHILRAAARQFRAGDVQHWWLPVTGQGIQTRVSDDRIWLPFVVAHYLEVTEEYGVLDEPVPFLEGGPLAAGQAELFAAAQPTADCTPLYEHCALALDSGLAIGSHGLPLFGTGDWNDGMNRVGALGQGESVWLGWFLYAALMNFAPLAERRGDAKRAALWRKQAFALQQAIEREAWDGDWYRRGYFDDGTPLGSVSSDECRIDSVAQSWAVISGAAPTARAARAMSAVNAQLVNRSEGLVQLFTPPFDRTPHDPGYIKAYPPGLRENGGQYTHAAMWCTLAFALLGDGDRAGELFSLINPVNHASTRGAVHRYKVEPYVVCADVYSAPSHIGRGGWTWYTGSAGWMYRTAIEGILGIALRGGVLRINPCIPRTWPGFEVTTKRGSSRYRIAVENPHGVCRGIIRAALDGRDIPVAPCDITLTDDGSYHYARITLG
jgi:cyclic beta-1,2-glucan synthetase